jgi:hypothetical protein
VPVDVALPGGTTATEAAREEVCFATGCLLESDVPHADILASMQHMLMQLRAAVAPGALQARNYVLEVSMDQQVEQSLSTRPCEHCGVDTYEANLACHACQAHWEPCAVSGYPVPPGERVVLCGNTAARRDDWNAWVNKFHTDPMTGAPATPLY